MSRDLIREAFRDRVLDRQVHERLITTIELTARRAGVPVETICRPLEHYAPDPVRDWVRKVVRSKGNPPPGLVLVGSGSRVMEGMAGCLLRHYINARITTTNVLVDEEPEATVLFLPGLGLASRAPDWKRNQIATAILDRLYDRRSTVLEIQDAELLGEMFGQAFWETIQRTYQIENL